MITRLLHPDAFTVAVVVIGLPDGDGVPVQTVSSREWKLCNAKVTRTSEDRTNGEVIATTLHVSGPLAEWISENDHMTRVRDSSEWRVDGAPTHYVAGALDHTELDLIRWTGE